MSTGCLHGDAAQCTDAVRDALEELHWLDGECSRELEHTLLCAPLWVASWRDGSDAANHDARTLVDVPTPRGERGLAVFTGLDRLAHFTAGVRVRHGAVEAARLWRVFGALGYALAVVDPGHLHARPLTIHHLRRLATRARNRHP